MVAAFPTSAEPESTARDFHRSIAAKSPTAFREQAISRAILFGKSGGEAALSFHERIAELLNRHLNQGTSRETRKPLWSRQELVCGVDDRREFASRSRCGGLTHPRDDGHSGKLPTDNVQDVHRGVVVVFRRTGKSQPRYPRIFRRDSPTFLDLNGGKKFDRASRVK
jgi:hypothetical protein